MITNLFGCREIQAYVTATEKEPLNQTGSDRMKYIPLFCTRSGGILKQATMIRKPSGHFAVIWYEAARVLKCW